MQKLTKSVQMICMLCLLICCSGTSGRLVIEKPEAGKSIVVGAVLVENDGIDDLYQTKTANITVILVGKSVREGQEKQQGYRIRTDKNGYFALQNVPPGAYVLKGIEVDVGYTNRHLITSRWEGNRQLYIPEDQMIDFSVRVWPEPVNSKVIDLGIHYFKLDNAGRIYSDQFKALNNARLGLKNKYYNMVQPATYFHDQYPSMEWFQ